MAAMVSRRKFGLSRVLALKHSGRMRHANEKHRVLASFRSCVVKRAPGVLLEHVLNVLDACEFALANAIDRLIQPANRRTQRNAVVPNFAFALSFLERLPERVVMNLLHPDIVQLEQ